jgi:hypothetical protein
MSERSSSTIRGRDTAPAKSDAQVRSEIDAFYDKAETYVAGIGRIVGVDTSTQARCDERDVIASPARQLPPVATRQLPSAPEPRFEIVEVPAYQVTNGHQSLTLLTRDEAEAVLAKLREAGQ